VYRGADGGDKIRSRDADAQSRLRLPGADGDSSPRGHSTPETLAADLIWVVNQDSVEIHPWLSRKENLNYPDLLVFDLDPGSRLPFQRLCEAATEVKEALDALAVKSW